MPPNLPLIQGANWPIPDWSEIEKDEPEGDTNEFWCSVGSQWMDLLTEYLGAPYQITESPHFWLISSFPAKQAIDQVKWLEGTLQKIRKRLGPLGQTALLGKTPVLIFGNDDDYYDYIANYYSEGEWSGSGGIYLNHGYGHFAIPQSAEFNLAGALAHELTHALIGNQDIPLWLNEGLTQICEESIAGYLSFDMDTLREHLDHFWNETTIQWFWDGSGFQKPDETQTLCYHLAQLLVYRLIGDRHRFNSFAQDARASDAGEASLIANYGISLQDLIEGTLGDGNWSYRKRP